MAYDMVRYERGQVWMIRYKHPDPIGKEIKKDRPWLILSVGEYNKKSGMITAVPLTTKDHIVAPSQVLIDNDRGVKNVIKCEQIKTFDYSSGEYILDFMGTVSDEILEKVDVALSIHLGLHYSPITLNKLYESMEAIIKSIGYMQEKSETPKFTDDDVIQFAEKLQLLASNTANDEVSDTNEDELDPWGVPLGANNKRIRIHNIPSPESVSVVEYNSSSSQDNIKKVKKRQQTWTPEKCEEFLSDVSLMTVELVMKKWDIHKKSGVYSTKYYVQKLLGKR